MKPVFEPPRLNREDLPVVSFERKEPSFAWNWHYHSQLELTWIRKGSGIRVVADSSSKYGPGDLVLLGSNVPHTWFSRRSSTRNEALVTQFNNSTLPESLLSLPIMSRINILVSESQRGLHFPAPFGRKLESKLLSLLKKRGVDSWLTLLGILEDLTHLPSVGLASPDYWHRRSFKMTSRLERVMAHIERHCNDDLPLRKIAGIAGLTESSFSRFFRKMTHQTFSDFRNVCRIKDACRRLIETDATITNIAHDCGFNNLTNFNRRFRREKNMSPREFRRLRNHPPAN